MQTYTHLVIGGALGSLLAPHNPEAQLFCVAGSVLPDAGMTVSYALDVLKKRKPMAYQPPWVIWSKEIPHSLIMCTLLLLIPLILGTGQKMGQATFNLMLFCIGLNSHAIIDVFTHGRPRPDSQDSTGSWPFKFNVGNIFGFWDYRIGQGNLFPKTAEFFIGIAVCGIWLSSTHVIYVRTLAGALLICITLLYLMKPRQPREVEVWF